MPSILDQILNLFRKPAQPRSSLDSPNEPAQIVNSKVLVLVFDPVMDPATGQTLSRQQNWYRPTDLVTGFMGDLLRVSGGLVRYQVVERLEVNEFPSKTDGFLYTPQAYMDVLRSSASPHMPQGADYAAILARYKILARVARGEIDEVWVFGFPHAGFYESVMAGPEAFWCNAPPLRNTDAARRRFVIMGFSYERQVGEMLEAYGHRAESIMEKVFEKLSGDINLWRRFIRIEKNTPGKAACGNIHFAPNSLQDYDWNNPAQVLSECYDWKLNFPKFKGDIRTVGAAEWGSGDMRAHHLWWFDHFPKVAGRRNGVHNNWWQYIADPNRVLS